MNQMTLGLLEAGYGLDEACLGTTVELGLKCLGQRSRSSGIIM